MVATATAYTDSRYRAYPGEGYDGVVRVSAGNYYGSGVLLYDGRAVLTAAHLLYKPPTGAVGSATVRFETAQGNFDFTSTQISVLSSYDPLNINDDLALIWLPAPAPVAANRYELYRAHDELGQVMTLVGYGVPGTGAQGEDEGYTGAPLRLMACNRADTDVGIVENTLGNLMAWNPKGGTQLVADFDNGTAAQDALGRLLGLSDLGQGLNEGMISSGDSGGPAFIQGKVAGIASYRASLERGATQPDVDAFTNSSFGELGFWQRASYYQQWIDQSLRARYPNAPTRPEEVQKQVVEGNGGTTYAYFLLQFTGVRSNPDAWLSVDYATRDGTAAAGSDYIAVRGTLVLYPDENRAVIPVEILGDTRPEPDETFYLDVFNPVGGSFGEGVIKLTAVRTILDDGSLWA